MKSVCQSMMYKSGPLNVIGQLSHDGIGRGRSLNSVPEPGHRFAAKRRFRELTKALSVNI